jgi:hypothetical protein
LSACGFVDVGEQLCFLQAIGEVDKNWLRFAGCNYCSRISFYQRNRAQLDGGAQQRGARIGPTYTNPQIE